ncbi:MAG TPA: molybdopterin molybdotransferase MoeA [Anaerolineales bacterium]|nr:molybdopterin molybdotransferase MoeA [Anaerolineales bacterium]HNN12620.1 molybdopterin molybdotransferase MoeA [Anaerolineales bacterium]
MLSVTEARERILSHFQPKATETVSLIASANRVLGADITADHDYPPFDNSAVDGFALRAEDTSASLTTLKVVADIPAGAHPQVLLSAGEAARIMTGAQIPEGANAVVLVEDTDFSDRQAGLPAPSQVTFKKTLNPGENVRRRGMDVRTQEIVLQKGRLLKPQDLGVLAMLGVGDVTVFHRPRVALLSSGDELLDVHAPLEPGKIRDTNSYTIAALAENAGAEVLRLGVARDTREAVTALLDQAAQSQADLILSSAGVSVGAFDYIKEVIDANGKMDFWKVNMRPGKPLAFGAYRGIPFIGLPGNPVSAFVGFEVFVRPVLERMNGRMDSTRPRVKVRCAEQIESDGRESYLRARVYIEGGIQTATLTGHQGSGNLLSLVQADALLIIPAGVKCVPAGQEVDAYLL